jgi:phage host-nuclease inhibitor protein Gam
MNSDPTKSLGILLRSRESAERTVREIVQRQLDREKLIAARDTAVEKVTALHNPKIDDLTTAIDRDFELLEVWAEDNREDFGKVKSMALAGHRIGWRTGNPKVEARGKLTLKTILARLVEAGGDLKKRFVREKPELNKESVLEMARVAEGRSPALDTLQPEQREEAQTAARGVLKEIGVTVSQTESFYLEPDREGQPEIRLVGETKDVA